MFKEYDEFGRPFRRQPGTNTITIPRRTNGYGRQPVDPREAALLLQQELHQARAEAAAWRDEAQKWHTAVQQQKIELKTVRQEVEAARQKIAALETDRTEAAEAWQEKVTRLYADLENSKKRLAQRYAQEAEQAKENVIRDMLTVADNLERALAHAAGTSEETGIALTLKAFTGVMSQHGVQPIEAEGQPFDPTQHEAVGTEASAEQEPGMVTAVVEKGYRLHDRLLRPARVLVAE